MTWNDLLTNVSKVTPNYNDIASPAFFDLDVNYNSKKQSLMFTARASSARSGHKYSVAISFFDIESTEGLKEEEILEGYMPKPDLSKHSVKVSCDCPSFLFRFDKADRKSGSGLNKRAFHYHRKTLRTSNNPDNLPGVCYHLIAFVKYLQSQGFTQ